MATYYCTTTHRSNISPVYSNLSTANKMAAMPASPCVGCYGSRSTSMCAERHTFLHPEILASCGAESSSMVQPECNRQLPASFGHMLRCPLHNAQTMAGPRGFTHPPRGQRSPHTCRCSRPACCSVVGARSQRIKRGSASILGGGGLVAGAHLVAVAAVARGTCMHHRR